MNFRVYSRISEKSRARGVPLAKKVCAASKNGGAVRRRLLNCQKVIDLGLRDFKVNCICNQMRQLGGQ